MKNIDKEVQAIVKANRFIPKARWKPEYDRVLEDYAGNVSNKGLLEIMRKLFPDGYFTYASVAKRVSRRRGL